MTLEKKGNLAQYSKGLYSVLALRHILNQNGRHGCLLAYTSKKLTSADQAKLYTMYIKGINALPAPSCLLVPQRAGWHGGKRTA